LSIKNFDLFQDVFAHDHFKITKAIERKKEIMGINDDDNG